MVGSDSRNTSNLDSIINAIRVSASKQKVEITKYKIQKLLYLVCGYNIGFFDEWLLDADQNFQAQENGPVLEAIETENQEFDEETIPLSRTKLPSSVECIVDEVVGKYGNHSDEQLKEETHDEPWEKAHARGKNAYIDRNDMRDFYKKELNVPSKVEVVYNVDDADRAETIKLAKSLEIWK